MSILQKEYGAKDDKALAALMAKYFEVNEDDAMASINAYRALPGEDYEMQSNKVEHARL